MLNRQKCILLMIDRAGRPVTHLEIIKWAFLTALEMPSGGGSSFYDFLPYQYGPFSFAMFRELGGLARKGYIRDAEWSGHAAWELVGNMRGEIANLAKDVRRDAARVVERFISKSDDELIDYVYERFPWYTANSKIRRLVSRPVADAAVYTVGYEGCSIDGLLNVLMRQGIHRIVDVRRNPVARRYGFHKSSLTRLCGNVSIDYIHVPEVGIPSELRRELDSPSSYAKLFDQYERELLPKAPDAVQAIAGLVVEKPTTLMCMEADPDMCHRTRLANSVAAITHLPIHHIEGETCEQVVNFN
ncbi:MAG: DUF488 domain-containing protein [Phycisphaerae bacterium]|nr:DUF488 domain-containing protein [Phycisphaerae bacterium]